MFRFPDKATTTFRSLGYRDFRLYFLGQVVSLNGNWMQNVAQAWLVYRLTGSSVMLGLLAFCRLIPVLVFSLYGGVLADQVNRWRLLFAAHMLGLAQAVALGLLTLLGVVATWHVLVLALIYGIIHALEMPTRHSFIAQLVPREELSNAIALNSSAFNVARFMGPTLAGLLVAWAGEGLVFLVNAASFGGILVALSGMGAAIRGRQPASGRGRAAIREGLRFAWRQAHVRAVLALVAMMSMVAATTTVLMPVIAKEVFAGGSEEMGLLLGAMGVGALLGALHLAQRTSGDGLDRLIGLAGVAAGLALFAFSMSDQLWVALALLVVVGFCQTTLVASSTTLIQLLVPDMLRGRIMSVFSMVFVGLMPFGSLVAGTVAHFSGVPVTVAAFGAVCLLGSAVFLIRVPPVDVSQDPTPPWTSE